MGIGAVEIEWFEYRNGWQSIRGEVIEEALVSVYVNGVELATLMATPRHLDWLALGLLKNEGIIKNLDDVRDVRVNPDGCCVDIWLTRDFSRPERKIVTSGCGGGVTFQDPTSEIAPLDEELTITPKALHAVFNRLQEKDSLYARSRGVHTAGLVDNDEILALAEDVGRHNTIDKLVGYCLLRGIETRGRLLLATGRVSSEMVRKSVLMRCPIIASRNSPTSLSIQLARAWNITLVGYVRRGGLRVYSVPHRLSVTASVLIASGMDDHAISG